MVSALEDPSVHSMFTATLRGVNHELANAVNAVMMNAELAKATLIDPGISEEHRATLIDESIEGVFSAGIALQALVDKLNSLRFDESAHCPAARGRSDRVLTSARAMFYSLVPAESASTEHIAVQGRSLEFYGHEMGIALALSLLCAVASRSGCRQLAFENIRQPGVVRLRLSCDRRRSTTSLASKKIAGSGDFRTASRIIASNRGEIIVRGADHDACIDVKLSTR